MKIAYDNQIFFFERYGGISRYFTSLINELVKTDNEYKIFSSLYLNEYLSNFDKKVINGLKFDKYPPKTTTILKYLSNSIDNFNTIQWNPDVIHETFYSSRKLYSKKIPIVVTIHDMIHELYPEMFNINDFTSQNKKSAVDRADKIICVSETTKIDLINFYNVPKNKIDVVYHGYTYLHNNEHHAIDLLTLPDVPFLLYIGKRNGYKNFEKYLQAISISNSLKRDFKLIFFGGGAFSTKELNLFLELGFADHEYDYFEGNDDLLHILLKNATALVYPSLYEGFGLPLLEAMYCGCPIITSKSGSIPEIAKDAAEYFNPTSIDDICSSIQDVVYSNEKIKTLKNNSKKQIVNYSWEKAAYLTNKLYHSLL